MGHQQLSSTAATVFNIQKFCTDDGPGIRTTVFLKGCHLRCAWCHNPEGLSREPQLYSRKTGCLSCGLCRRGCSHPDCQPFGRCLHICPQGLLSVAGKQITAEALAARILRDAPLFEGGGGVTFSGGEPFAQAEGFTKQAELLKAAGYEVASYSG